MSEGTKYPSYWNIFNKSVERESWRESRVQERCENFPRAVQSKPRACPPKQKMQRRTGTRKRSEDGHYFLPGVYYYTYFFLSLCEVVSFDAGRPVFLPFTHGPRGFALSWSTINAFAAASLGVSTKRLMEFAMQLLRSLGIFLVLTGWAECL
jgi:hypothetical protein